jgi:hypothetical protein
MGSRRTFSKEFKLDAVQRLRAGEPAGLVARSLKHDPCRSPAGEKQLRYRISAASFGVDEINALLRKVLASLLEAFVSLPILNSSKVKPSAPSSSLLHEQPSAGVRQQEDLRSRGASLPCKLQ